MSEVNLNSLFQEFMPNMDNISGGVFSMSKINLNPKFSNVTNEGKGIFIIENVFNDEEINKIKDFFLQLGEFAPVSVQGMQNIEESGIGSHRITAYLPNLASVINQKILETGVKPYFIATDYTPTDWHQGDLGRTWEVAGISPMFRFMKYTQGGKHYPHYDAGYIYPKPYTHFRTLGSYVLYLTTNDSGATRFINDGQENIKIMERNHDDWDREATEDEVYFKSLPVKAKMVIFPHRLCHDVEEFVDEGSERIIIRGDVLFNLKES